MFRDMTIGQFYPVDSPIHRLDPRVKVIGVLLYLISLFLFDGFAGYAIATVFLVSVIAISKVPFSYVIKGMRPIFFLLIFTSMFHLFGTDGDVVIQWRFIHITWQGIQKAIFLAMRLMYLIFGSSMLTYTTTPNQLTDAIEKMFHPLNKIKVPVHEFAMMMSLALRFIPILLEEANRIINAQSARGANFNEGSLVTRMRAMVSILVPLLVSATRRAYDLANAMEARCYQGGDGRTKMKPLRYRVVDYAAYFVMVAYVAIIVVINRFIPF